MNYQIIAVDFDGTLCFSNWPELGEPNCHLIEYLRNWREQGNKLILWTCRAGDALERAISWCHDHHLEFDAINDKSYHRHNYIISKTLIQTKMTVCSSICHFHIIDILQV